jgi:hypothetical protein
MTAKEFAERRYVTRTIFAVINYARSKLAGYPTDFQVEGFPADRPTVWKVVLTVEYKPQGPPLEITPSLDVDGRLA